MTHVFTTGYFSEHFFWQQSKDRADKHKAGLWQHPCPFQGYPYSWSWAAAFSMLQAQARTKQIGYPGSCSEICAVCSLFLSSPSSIYGRINRCQLVLEWKTFCSSTFPSLRRLDQVYYFYSVRDVTRQIKIIAHSKGNFNTWIRFIYFDFFD